VAVKVVWVPALERTEVTVNVFRVVS
jgi:hypothetical protein